MMTVPNTKETPVADMARGIPSISAMFEKDRTPIRDPSVPKVPRNPMPFPLFSALVESAISSKTIGEYRPPLSPQITERMTIRKRFSI